MIIMEKRKEKKKNSKLLIALYAMDTVDPFYPS